MSGGFQRAVTTMALEKKKAAKDLAATKKAVKELAATERKKKKKEPTANSSIKASSVSGSPLKDKSNEDNSNVHPSKKGITKEAEIGTKLHSVTNDSEIIAELNAALKQANVKSDEHFNPPWPEIVIFRQRSNPWSQATRRASIKSPY
jgi:hypothetical protein